MIFRPTYHAVVPADAKFFTKDGQRHARFRLRSGELVSGPIMPSGKARIQSPFWYARVRQDGQSLRLPLRVKDKTAAAKLAVERQVKADQGLAGIDDRFAPHRAKKMPEHLEDYKLYLEGKNCNAKHVKETDARITKMLKACQFDRPEHLDQSDLDRYLADMVRKGWSRRTRNLTLKSLRAMVAWMLKSDRIAVDPFRMSQLLNEESCPKRRRRRTLTAVELGRVIAAAESGKTIRGVSGRQRALVYLTAGSTGLRRNELAQLTVQDLHLDHDPPYISLPATVDKANHDASLPIHETLAPKLREWVKDRRQLVFDLLLPSGFCKPTGLFMRRDCEAAGVPYETKQGVADFHAHRSAFITALCRSGADFALVVKMARHSTPALTALVYDKCNVQDKAKALNQLVLPAPAKS